MFDGYRWNLQKATFRNAGVDITPNLCLLAFKMRRAIYSTSGQKRSHVPGKLS